MQTEPIQIMQEVIVTGAWWYLVIAASIFASCLVADRIDKWFNLGNYDHKSFPFYLCVLFYAYFSAIWLPCCVSDFSNKFKSKKESQYYD